MHVMIKHDKDACKRKGQDIKGYTPRKSLEDIEKIIAARKEMGESNSPQPTIEIQEDEKDDDILAALNKDCEQ